jgi:cyclic pyranopterin phosphate synthase
MLSEIRSQIPELERYGESEDPNDTSKYWRVPGYQGRVGFITSMSEHFCGTCNRMRLTADGNLKVCLFGTNKEELSLRDALRGGATEAELRGLINHALAGKKFALGGHGDMYGIAADDDLRAMIRIGG